MPEKMHKCASYHNNFDVLEKIMNMNLCDKIQTWIYLRIKVNMVASSFLCSSGNVPAHVLVRSVCRILKRSLNRSTLAGFYSDLSEVKLFLVLNMKCFRILQKMP